MKKKILISIACLLIITLSSFSQQTDFSKFSLTVNSGFQLKGPNLKGDYPQGFIDDFSNLNSPFTFGINLGMEYYFDFTDNLLGVGIGYGNYSGQHSIPIYVSARGVKGDLVHIARFGGSPTIICSLDEMNTIQNTDYEFEGDRVSVYYSEVEGSFFFEYGIEKALSEKISAGLNLRYSLYMNSMSTSRDRFNRETKIFHSLYPNFNISINL